MEIEMICMQFFLCWTKKKSQNIDKRAVLYLLSYLLKST